MINVIRLISFLLLTQFSVVMAETLDVAKINEKSISLTSHMGILEDINRALLFADVSSEGTQFKTDLPDTDVINLSYTTSAFWLRIVIENTDDYPIEKIIEIDNPLIKYVDFYWQVNNTNYQIIHTGYARPFENREYKSRIFAFPLLLQAHSQNIIYFRLASPNAYFIKANLWQPSEFELKERNFYIIQAFYFCSVIVITLFSLVLALVLKEQDYLYYAGVMFFIILSMLSQRGLGSEFIWTNSPFLTQIGRLLFGSLALLSQLMFLHKIFERELYLTKINWLLKVLIVVQLVLIILLFLNFYFLKIIVLINVISNILLLILFALNLKNIFHYSMSLLFAGFIFYNIGSIAHYLQVFGLAPTHYLTVYSVQISTLFESILFLIFLSLRYQCANKDRDTIEGRRLVLLNQVNQMQKMESLSRLTSGIAHDFNNILSAIIGYNQLNNFAGEDCENQKLKEEILFNTEQVNMASERATNLIKKMMTYSRQNTQNKEIEVKPTHEVIDEVLSMIRPALTSKFQLNAELDNDLTIQIDSTELHQILTNLIVNARDAMKQGGLITISLRQVTTHELVCNSCVKTLVGDFIELSVADNGTGIEQEVITHIFDPFFTTKPVGEGTGLGLSTVSGMVHEAHGHITIESKMTAPNTGTTFRLLFPLVNAV